MPSLLQRKTTIATATALIFIAGVLAGYWRHGQTRDQLLAELTTTAERSAVSFDVAELQRFSATASDFDDPAFAAVTNRLIRLRSLEPRIRSVYLLRHLPRTGTVVFLADSGSRAGSARAAPGDAFVELPQSGGIQEVVNTGAPCVEGPRAGASGNWISAYALVGPGSPGRPQHVLGLDVSARQWNRAIWSAALGTAGYVWMLLLLPLASLISTHRQLLQGEALRNLTEAMEQGHSPVVILDLGLRIEYANAKFCRLLGYPRRDLIGREWREFHGNEAGPDLLPELVTTIRAGHAWTGEWLLPRKNGPPFPVRATVTPVKNRGGATRSFVGVFEDMTEIRQTEALLREAKERAEAGDRAKGRFLATMSHEVRTPLNGIVGFASLLLETKLTPEQQEYVDTIRTSSETLIQLTGDILDYARIESGRLKLEPQPCDPRECVENALDLAAAPALQKNIELLHWIEEDVPPAIMADVGRLRQVIVNLVNNAVKFTPGGEVEVRVRRLPGNETAVGANCALEFSVRDTGIGIAPEHHGKIFRPFSQVDESTTRRFGGTGLGLAICKTIVELMDGTISFTSELGRGSTFVFTIRVPVHADTLPPETLRPLALGGRRLAVAAASRGLREELARLGKKLGAEVVETSPEELATLTNWDLAMIDVSGPLAMELSALTSPRRGLPPEKLIALVPIMLPTELRHALHTHFRLLLNKPLHHEMVAGVLAGPSAAQPAAPTAQAGAPAPDRCELRVLIVEDNAVNQRLIQNMVKQLGCTWTTAPNGRVAVEILAETRPDVVLMDLHMPELDGLTATVQIRAGEAGPEFSDVWIIALTADARTEQRQRTLAAGANDYLTKPVRPTELHAAFQRFLQARRQA